MEKATYVSVWDDCTAISTPCDYDRETKTVSNIGSEDVDGMDIDVCTDEYVQLSDGTEVRDFVNADL
jgi:hypothetical protein